MAPHLSGQHLDSVSRLSGGSDGGVTGLLTQEAQPGGTAVTYKFTAQRRALTPITAERKATFKLNGLYGAIIVLPSSTPINCTANGSTPPGEAICWANELRKLTGGNLISGWRRPLITTQNVLRPDTVSVAEMDANIHRAALAQVTAKGSCAAGLWDAISSPTEPYQPSYFRD